MKQSRTAQRQACVSFWEIRAPHAWSFLLCTLISEAILKCYHHVRVKIKKKKKDTGRDNGY